jgi:hypothetical protein
MPQGMVQSPKCVKCPTLTPAQSSPLTRLLPKAEAKETQIQVYWMGEGSHWQVNTPIGKGEIGENLMIQTSCSLELGTHHARVHGCLHQTSSPVVKLESSHCYEYLSGIDHEPPLHDFFLALKLACPYMNDNSAKLSTREL